MSKLRETFDWKVLLNFEESTFFFVSLITLLMSLITDIENKVIAGIVFVVSLYQLFCKIHIFNNFVFPFNVMIFNKIYMISITLFMSILGLLPTIVEHVNNNTSMYTDIRFIIGNTFLVPMIIPVIFYYFHRINKKFNCALENLFIQNKLRRLNSIFPIILNLALLYAAFYNRSENIDKVSIRGFCAPNFNLIFLVFSIFCCLGEAIIAYSISIILPVELDETEKDSAYKLCLYEINTICCMFCVLWSFYPNVKVNIFYLANLALAGLVFISYNVVARRTYGSIVGFLKESYHNKLYSLIYFLPNVISCFVGYFKFGFNDLEFNVYDILAILVFALLLLIFAVIIKDKGASNQKIEGL